MTLKLNPNRSAQVRPRFENTAAGLLEVGEGVPTKRTGSVFVYLFVACALWSYASVAVNCRLACDATKKCLFVKDRSFPAQPKSGGAADSESEDDALANEKQNEATPSKRMRRPNKKKAKIKPEPPSAPPPVVGEGEWEGVVAGL